ncbi:MAG: hypothetical protein ACREX4_09525 [Gammaproteobacteria bacterium]
MLHSRKWVARTGAIGGLAARKVIFTASPCVSASTGSVYLSRFPGGRTAPIHAFDGLPEKLIVQRAASGKVIAVKSSVTLGSSRWPFPYPRTSREGDEVDDALKGCLIEEDIRQDLPKDR